MLYTGSIYQEVSGVSRAVNLSASCSQTHSLVSATAGFFALNTYVERGIQQHSVDFDSQFLPQDKITTCKSSFEKMIVALSADPMLTVYLSVVLPVLNRLTQQGRTSVSEIEVGKQVADALFTYDNTIRSKQSQLIRSLSKSDDTSVASESKSTILRDLIASHPINALHISTQSNPLSNSEQTQLQQQLQARDQASLFAMWSSVKEKDFFEAFYSPLGFSKEMYQSLFRSTFLSKLQTPENVNSNSRLQWTFRGRVTLNDIKRFAFVSLNATIEESFAAAKQRYTITSSSSSSSSSSSPTSPSSSSSSALTSTIAFAGWNDSDLHEGHSLRSTSCLFAAMSSADQDTLTDKLPKMREFFARYPQLKQLVIDMIKRFVVAIDLDPAQFRLLYPLI